MAQMHNTYSTMDSRMYMAEQGEKGAQNEKFLWKLVLLSALAYLVWTDKIAIVLDPFAGNGRSTATGNSHSEPARAALFSIGSEDAKPDRPKKRRSFQVKMPRSSLNNVTLAIDPEYAGRYEMNNDVAGAYLEKCRDYVERFGPVAIAEMHKFGIPASVTLAQGLLESNAGESKLATKTNNHFGIKCFSNSCGKGHCANFSDDTHKDFFVRYNSVWGSYRGHSQFLKNTARYAGLFKLSPTDYKEWAFGIEKAGYATNKHYAEQLIAIIENLNLDRFDRQ